MKLFHAKTIEEHKAVVALLNEALSQKDAPLAPIIGPKLVQPFCDHLDEQLWEMMEDCFGRFNNIFEKFLSELEMRQLPDDFEKCLLQQFDTLMVLSGYTRKLQVAPRKDRVVRALCTPRSSSTLQGTSWP